MTNIRPIGEFLIDLDSAEGLGEYGKLYAGYDRLGRRLAVGVEPNGITAQVMTDRLGNVLMVEPALANVLKAITGGVS